jgi:Beta/Gamma crystallin
VSPVFRRLIAALIVVVLVPALAPTRVGAASPSAVDLDGAPASILDVPTLHCHDLDAPIIRCFRTETGLQTALSARTSQSGVLTAGVAYVEMFEHTYYGGASFVVSEDYPNLGSIGWNDRVSSFRGLNSYYGTFFQHANYVGAYWRFGPNQQVFDVGTAWNDFISSVWRG